MKLRTHAQTAGVSLTAQQPYNNVVRVALQALAAVLGGTQSLHTNSLDETYALPTEEAVHHRAPHAADHRRGDGRRPRVDPLGGSYFVEYLTDEIEKRALEYIHRIDEMGGMVCAVEKGYPQREIAASAYRFQRQLESGRAHHRRRERLPRRGRGADLHPQDRRVGGAGAGGAAPGRAGLAQTRRAWPRRWPASSGAPGTARTSCRPSLRR